MMSETDLAWAAGIVDADGCIDIHRLRRTDGVYYALRVRVSQVVVMGSEGGPPPVIEKLSAIGGRVYLNKRSRTGDRDLWDWNVTSRQAEEFLRAIRPYLVGKADQADVALAYRENAVGLGAPNPEGRVIAEAAYTRLRSMKNHTWRHGDVESQSTR